MPRPRTLISAFFAFASTLLAIAVLTVWGRSQRYADHLFGFGRWNFAIESWHGSIEVVATKGTGDGWSFIQGWGQEPVGQLITNNTGALWIPRLGFRLDYLIQVLPVNSAGFIVDFPHWIPFLLFSAYPFWFLLKSGLRRKRVKAGHCVVCDYDLRGSAERCPECGRDVLDSLELTASNPAP